MNLAKNLLGFIAGLAQQLEHVLLVHLNTGLIEGVDAQHIGGNAAAQLQEVEQLAQLALVQLAHIHGDDRHAAIYMSSHGAQVRLLVHEVQSFAGEVVQAVQAKSKS